MKYSVFQIRTANPLSAALKLLGKTELWDLAWIAVKFPAVLAVEARMVMLRVVNAVGALKGNINKLFEF